jgi:hypothetical protein
MAGLSIANVRLYQYAMAEQGASLEDCPVPRLGRTGGDGMPPEILPRGRREESAPRDLEAALWPAAGFSRTLRRTWAAGASVRRP